MKLVALLSLFLAFVNPVRLNASENEPQIERVLEAQVEAWNRGDILAFVKPYAADCIFVGKEVAHGKAQLLARYKKRYPTREAMGHLTFRRLQVHLLTTDVAIITGEWQLNRASAAGGVVGGLFSLVFHREGKEWKIALDHTS